MLLALQFILFYLDELNLLARVYLCLLLTFSGLTHYLATAVRPYGMAALCTLVSSVLLVRSLREPTRRRAVAYAVWTWVMLNTMAFEIAAFMVQALVAGVSLAVDMGRIGWRETIRRHRYLVIAMVAVVLGYVPYLLMALHYQYHSNPTDTLRYVLSVATYERAIQSHFQLSPPLMMGVLALCVVGLIGELRARNVDRAVVAVDGGWADCVRVVLHRGAQSDRRAGQIHDACVRGGRGPLRPGLSAAGAARPPVGLAGHTRSAGLRAWPRWQEFHAYMRTAVPVGGFGVLRLEMAKHPGKKVMFFDIGYDGQHLEHIIRDDPDVTTATHRGRGWSSGGNALNRPIHSSTPCGRQPLPPAAISTSWRSPTGHTPRPSCPPCSDSDTGRSRLCHHLRYGGCPASVDRVLFPGELGQPTAHLVVAVHREPRWSRPGPPPPGRASTRVWDSPPDRRCVSKCAAVFDPGRPPRGTGWWPGRCTRHCGS